MIPNNASDVKLYYSPAFMQGGEDLALQFSTDEMTIVNYKNKFFKQVNKIDPPTPNFDYAQEGFSVLGYSNVPAGFVCYLLSAQTKDPSTWNHGSYSFFAINSDTNTIAFFSSNW